MSFIAGMKVGLAFIPLLYLEGCYVHSDHYTVYIDPAFGNATPKVAEALRVWEEGIRSYGDELHLDMIIQHKACDKDCQYEIAIHLVSPESLHSIPGTNDNSLGFTMSTDASSSNIYIADNFGSSEIDMVWVVAHELGHAMGLGHTQAGTLMNKIYQDQNHAITCQDVQQWASLRSQQSMPTCGESYLLAK